MCNVCNCFAWTLDLFQRALTFCLSCWLATSVCCGLLIAVIAGIAYGYNYCLAEFVTLTRADIKVFMRRGQFYDRPDLLHVKRKMGEDEDVFPFNLTEDYKQELQSNDEAALSKKWMIDQDTRKYAEKLTKYAEHPQRRIAENERTEGSEEPSYILPVYPTQHLSVMSYPVVPTTIWESGSSEIIMRMFNPVPRATEHDSDTNKHYDNKVYRALGKLLANPKKPEQEEAFVDGPLDIRLRVESNPKSELKRIINLKTASTPKKLEYSSDVDEDNIIYKSV